MYNLEKNITYRLIEVTRIQWDTLNYNLLDQMRNLIRSELNRIKEILLEYIESKLVVFYCFF